MAESDDESTQLLACAACGRKYAPDEDHPCLRKAEEAETERREAAARGEPTGVEHIRVRGKFAAASNVRMPGDMRALAPHIPSFEAGDGPDVLEAKDEPLACYRDDSGDADGTAGQHWCLCLMCASQLRQAGVRLYYLGNLEGERSTLRTLLTAEQAKDWKPDFDGCDRCGKPPHGQQRVRQGSSELFAILYSGQVDPLSDAEQRERFAAALSKHQGAADDEEP